MRYFVFTIVIGAFILASCSGKEIAEKPVNGVYPHLLKAEEEFVQQLDELSQLPFDKSEKEIVRIKKEFFDMLAKDTTSLSHEFGSLLKDEDFDVVTSPDKKLRIYVTKFDMEMDSSINFIQYRDDMGKIHTMNAGQWKKQNVDLTDADINILFEHLIYNILDFSCKDGTNLYVINSDDRIETHRIKNGVTCTSAAYKIRNGTLEPVEAFVLGNKKSQNIVREYDYSYLWYYPEEQQHSFAEVDSVNHILYVGNEDGSAPTDRYQCFQFNGTDLIEIGESAPFWLHHSLHNYKRIETVCVSKSHIIRIDDMGDGVCRYASWPRNAKFADEPSLVIYGKQTRITNEDGTIIFLTSFTNDGYEYRIPLHPHRWGMYATEMEIYKNGKLIQVMDFE